MLLKNTLPTRLQGALYIFTLINNMCSSILDENLLSTSGIRINDISDHKMTFTYFGLHTYRKI